MGDSGFTDDGFSVIFQSFGSRLGYVKVKHGVRQRAMNGHGKGVCKCGESRAGVGCVGSNVWMLCICGNMQVTREKKKGDFT